MIKVGLIMENINLYVQVLENMSLCLQPFFLRIIYYLKIILQIIRFVIPILLIFKMGLTFYKGLINPSEKAPIKNVTGKIIACVIVFLVPTLIKVIMALIEQIMGVNYYNGVTECYTFADKEYIKILEQNQKQTPFPGSYDIIIDSLPKLKYLDWKPIDDEYRKQIQNRHQCRK